MADYCPVFHVVCFTLTAFFNERSQSSMLFHRDLYRDAIGCLNYIIIGSNFEVWLRLFQQIVAWWPTIIVIFTFFTLRASF